MKKHTQKIIVNTLVVLLLLCATGWFASLFWHPGVEYTDNAQVRKDIVPVSSRVQGFVKEIRFSEFQKVRAGDTLLLIEDAEFRLRLAQAEADYRNALAGESAAGAGLATTDNNILATEAAIEEVRIQLAEAGANYHRYSNLLEKGAVTQQQFDGVKTQYEGLKAKVATMERQINTTRSARNEQEIRRKQSKGGTELTEAALNLARLNLSYTVITAPCDGVTSARTIQNGELLMPGQRLLSIVSDDEGPWVTANFRESQLGHIHVGDKVEIRVDALKGEKFTGMVEAIADATGAQYSPAAPDNATGNFVKIEQRIPVKIFFTSGPVELLVSGMNVTCKVRR
ncbi:MAG: HlyD family secretion protein [Bacteroidales bacterium]|nr:HlyD family secretion protein [Bacteroidales bacterium]